MARKKGYKVRAFMQMMKEVLKDRNTSLLTDTDLFYLINDRLPKEERISMSYYEFLKSPNQKHEKSISGIECLTTEEKQDFLNTLCLGRVKQKVGLTERAFDDKAKNAYPYLWALERKNTDLQLKSNQVSIGSGNTTLNITVGNEDHKSLIEGILNNTLDIHHEEIGEEKLLNE